MTVAELIAELQKLPQDLNVWIDSGRGYMEVVHEVVLWPRRDGVKEGERIPTGDPEWDAPHVAIY